jgi:3D (Asp-Asp-Asp) domain-containing protein
VSDGIVANNMLPFGTKIRMPELYGDKVFVVEDRMHQRKGKYHLDIWFPDQSGAKKFGAKITYVEVLEN